MSLYRIFLIIRIVSGDQYIYLRDAITYYFDATTLKLMSVQYADETIALTRDVMTHRVTMMSHSGGSFMELQYNSDGLVDAVYLTHESVRTFV